MVKNPPANAGDTVSILDRDDPLEKEMATHSRILAREIPQRSLAGYSPWGCKESDRTKKLTLSLSRGERDKNKTWQHCSGLL